jgi:hypothetical protein
VLNQTYDVPGRQNSLSAPFNSIVDFVNTYSYDTAWGMSQITQTGSIGGAPVACMSTAQNRILNDATTTCGYDAEGSQTSKADIATGTRTEYT